MPAYRFVNVWRLRAPIQDVFRIIDDVDAWPEWWPGVEAVERLGEAGADGLGASVGATFLGKLPYRLRFRPPHHPASATDQPRRRRHRRARGYGHLNAVGGAGLDRRPLRVGHLDDEAVDEPLGSPAVRG
jgi:hypothetical protein